MAGRILLGTCSWNYDSWMGLVYTTPQKRAADYLPEYAGHYRTAEIDSWFYRVPSRKDVQAYRDAVDENFRFTCKVPQEITLTHMRAKKGEPLVDNPGFLSQERFGAFLKAIEPLADRMDAVMFEFEYLNRQKMPSQDEFQEQLARFFADAPVGLPYALEPRNGNWLNEKYFQFLDRTKLMHVFSEKLYLPHVYEAYEKSRGLLHGTGVIRLMGGDRKAIEERTGEKWNEVVDEKADKDRIADMAADMASTRDVIINVNNHYEGSSPRTIAELRRLLKERTKAEVL